MPDTVQKKATTPQPVLPPISSRAELADEFALLLGVDETLPPSTWRAAGDPETLSGTLQLIATWLDGAATRLAAAQTVGGQGRPADVAELPGIPHVADPKSGEQVPAPGTRALFDVCVRAWHGGITPAVLQSVWTSQMRRLIHATQGTPGFRARR